MSCDYTEVCVYKVSICAAARGVAAMLTNASRHQYSISNDISPESFGLQTQWSMKER